MTPREFFNAWIGWSQARNENLEAVRNMIYGASRFNASATAFSSEQSKVVGNYKFPWEKPASDPISVHDKIDSFIRRQEMSLKKKKNHGH